jgi:hypothetical protein
MPNLYIFQDRKFGVLSRFKIMMIYQFNFKRCIIMEVMFLIRLKILKTSCLKMHLKKQPSLFTNIKIIDAYKRYNTNT